ncbi:TnsA-like heteromeric transposase endonuclease subunit [Streptomyces lunalinharesii]|uniref:TnsA-like heteromeric transposase endonuclease subunit n=1 Tax=Streptomyces lunalinharesii TaxID=333384 RepID=A0ABN3RPU5_9ACTN
MSPRRPRTLRPIHTAEDHSYLHYVDPAGTERLTAAEHAATVAFEDALPIRAIPSYAGQRHTPGHYWSASTDRLVGYESYLESKWMKLLDFDPQVAAFSAQPFTLESRDAEGTWRHTPDLFVRRGDGTALVLDVKDDAHLATPTVRRQARRTAAVCRTVGWEYAMAGEPDPLRWATVAWLAGYRRPLRAGAALVDAVLELAGQPVAVGELVSFQPVPELARAVVYHLMWHHRLTFDATRPLRDHTRVHRADVGGVA